MAFIKILKEKCVGCRLCINSCPYNAIKIEDKKAVILDNCTLCGACPSTCKLGAINYEKDIPASTLNIAAYKGVWVFGEQKNGVPLSVTMELIGEGRKLADKLGTELSVVLPGFHVRKSADRLIASGADIVYLAEGAALEHFNDELYCHLFTELIRKYKPEIVLLGATTYGRSLAPRIASRLNTGLTADCTGLDIDPDKGFLLQTRPAFGGNLMATIVCPNHRPQMSTVRPKVMKPLPTDITRKGKILRPEFKLPAEVRVKTMEKVSNLEDNVNLSEADIIVAGGRGLGNAANFRLVRELAEVLGGSVGATRSAVDAGWIDYSHQIGQTGKTVSPRIYFACGISGAIQHLAGMSSSDTIVAINKNPDAPVFKVATYGIVGDVVEILPKLIEEFRYRVPV